MIKSSRVLIVEEYSSVERLAALETEWRELWESDPHATIFQSPDWLLPWTRHLWRGGRIAVIGLRSCGGLVGLAPLFFWGYGTQPQTIRVSFLGSGITDYLGPIAAPGNAHLTATTVMNWLSQRHGEWDECQFEELSEASPLLAAEAPLPLQDGFEVFDEPCSVCPIVTLGGSFEEHLAGLDSKFRTGLRRAESRLREAGNFEIVKATDADWESLLDELFRLHALRWQGRDGEENSGGVLGSEPIRAFHREAAGRLLQRDALRLYGLYTKGKCIAVQYNIAAKGRVYAYLSGFDPAFARNSPGGVLLKHSMGEAVAEGCAEFDFLRKSEPFKYLWGARDRVNRKLTIRRRG